MPPPPAGPRVLFIYKAQVLVARLSSEPGPILPTVSPPPPKDGGASPPAQEPCTFASGKCFSAPWEPDLRRVIQEATSLNDLLKRLKRLKYRVEEQGPRFNRRPFFHL